MAPTVVVEFDYGMIDNTSLVLIPWARGIRALTLRLSLHSHAL